MCQLTSTLTSTSRRAVGSGLVRQLSQAGSQEAKITLPTVFSLGNGVCGFLSAAYTAVGRLHHACLTVLLALLLDGADGMLARRMRRVTRLGAEVDSLSDMVSFVIAPSLMYYVSYRSAGAHYALCTPLVLGGLFRLARFNLTPPLPYFQGLPTPPVGALLALLSVSGVTLPHAVVALLPAALAALMVSNIRYPSLKGSRRGRVVWSIGSVSFLSSILLFKVSRAELPSMLARCGVSACMLYIMLGPLVERWSREPTAKFP
ncbi:MAG: hypothetical protein DRN96_06675 [Thermoproteota archaeon]|nr:MAG: hypothetical protein DRN96_06675 [Candidatus Korarchaeota archaeon]